MSKSESPLKEGGAKQRGESLPESGDPALQKESRQSVLNQSTVEPEDYPDRDKTVTEKKNPSSRT